MTKKEYKIYLEEKDYQKLLAKAHQHNLTGKGCVSHFIVKISNEPIIFLSENLKTAFGLFDLKLGENGK